MQNILKKEEEIIPLDEMFEGVIYKILQKKK